MLYKYIYCFFIQKNFKRQKAHTNSLEKKTDMKNVFILNPLACSTSVICLFVLKFISKSTKKESLSDAKRTLIKNESFYRTSIRHFYDLMTACKCVPY